MLIASSQKQMIMQPNLIFRMSLNDKRIRSFGLSVGMFHHLRYNVAKVRKNVATCFSTTTLEVLSNPNIIWQTLNKIRQLNKHPIMMLEKRDTTAQ